MLVGFTRYLIYFANKSVRRGLTLQRKEENENEDSESSGACMANLVSPSRT